jgi:hypothetical protein
MRVTVSMATFAEVMTRRHIPREIPSDRTQNGTQLRLGILQHRKPVASKTVFSARLGHLNGALPPPRSRETGSLSSPLSGGRQRLTNEYGIGAG